MKKKKLVIKKFVNKVKIPENFESVNWNKLNLAIKAVQSRKGVDFSYEELYNAVEDLCTWKCSERIYSRLKKALLDYCELEWNVLENVSQQTVAFLHLVDKTWQLYCDQLKTVCSIFLYLDRAFAVPNKNVLSIWDLGLDLCKNQLIRKQDTILRKIVDGMFVMIQDERDGNVVPELLFYNLVQMLCALKLYESHFEITFLKNTNEYYKSEGLRCMDTLMPAQYMVHVEQRLMQEAKRSATYFTVNTTKALTDAVEKQLIVPHTNGLLMKGFKHLMDNLEIEHLKRMYVLFQRINALEELQAHFNLYIKEFGAKLVQDVNQEKTLITQLLSFKAKINQVLQDAFESYLPFVHTVKEAMEYAMNVKQNRPAELLAKYIDSRLRTGTKGHSELETEQLLDQCMILFRYLQGKDTFEAFYKKALARRLLLGKSASVDLERSMISKLKTECGNSFTSKLEGMFNDIELSQNVNRQFEIHQPSKMALEKLDKNIEMAVQVLTTGYWPIYTPMVVRFPETLVPYRNVFDAFYLEKYNGRQLHWQQSLAHCIVKAQFPKGRKELSVSMFQTIVLLCFNDALRLSFKALKESTEIEDGELRRTLQSLACGQVRVLKKEPKGREVEDSDEFLFNESFTNERIRIKINSIQLKETVKEDTDTHERVFRDRQYQVDAAVVRIMKSRKTLSHPLLMAELFSHLKFPAKPVDIKKRIESLIDRDYLERDSKSPQVYNYLA